MRHPGIEGFSPGRDRLGAALPRTHFVDIGLTFFSATQQSSLWRAPELRVGNLMHSLFYVCRTLSVAATQHGF